MRDWLCVPQRAGAAALALVLLAAGCSGDDDDAGGGGGGGLESLSGALGLLPDTGEDQVVVWGDFARAADIAGLERPDASDTEAAIDYLYAVTGTMADEGSDAPFVAVAAPEVAHMERSSELDAFTDDVGWNILEVDRFVERQDPPNTVAILGGSFDDGALTEAMGDPENGTWVAGSGGEGGEISPDDITPARPIGESMWLALDGDATLTVGRNPDDTAATRAAASGDAEGDTIADDPQLAALAAALDDQSAYSAMIVRPGLNGMGALGNLTPEQAQQRCQDMLPMPSAAVATGVAADDDGPLVLVGLAHDAADAAEANAEALESAVTDGVSAVTGQPWSDMFTLDGVETAGGDAVVARLRPTEPIRTTAWMSLILQRDSLVTSC
jgi:hypothetical protein